jgi:hypothetical protein
MLKVIKEGKRQYDPVYLRGVCPTCECIVECEHKDTHSAYGDPHNRRVSCPMEWCVAVIEVKEAPG